MPVRSCSGSNIRIDMQNLSAGTYIVILKTESFVKQIKVVKN
ncbi:MAG: T9SS type A sorting domain-containing protein [Bacteroidales bacterium]|nr:T9SS type A sorting domain-containing protein [Bacteroidales bacterium]MCF8344435.1 T9SS type A sorting domain-containing protein [Bacteroidales bacterium]MCF8351456.1 T9SS type A sorting domain-containing protein [Bacteroidales bacterium]MCF8375620.1 T9SS type A sorting domain-containing protein [Bacteroidales bacterium]MCF8400797.1 T9SS type A sorting domain-containing protein [Bacteroidales bacterium]